MKNYVLELDGLGLYLSAKQNLSGAALTKNVKKAMVFSEKDNPADKIAVWNNAIQIQCNSSLMNFDVKYS